MDVYLGIDYGKRKIGLSLSAGNVAVPLYILQNSPSVIEELKNIVKQERITKIVLGLPTNSQNQETQATRNVLAFQEELIGSVDVPVETFDERLTSRQAQRMGSGSKDDAHAAALLLQSYIDRHVSI